MKEKVNCKSSRFAMRAVNSIINTRKLVYFIFVCLIAFSVFALGWTGVNPELASCLPGNTNAGRGYDIMRSEFTDPATARIVIDNVSYSQGESIRDMLSEIDGVNSVKFDEADYITGTAYINVTFNSHNGGRAFKDVKDAVSGFDASISSSLLKGWPLNIDFGRIALLAAAIALLVVGLIFATRSYTDIFVVLITVAVSAIINLGTNWIFGNVSQLTDISAAVVLSAMTMYYGVMICRRYTKERKTAEAQEAIVTAVVGSMNKILGSGLLTIAAFAGLCFAGFGLGLDFGLVIIKGVAISIICTFVLMPCIMMTCSKSIDESKHKCYLRKLKNRGKFTIKTKYALPICFAVLAVGALVFSLVYPVNQFSYNEYNSFQPLLKDSNQWIDSHIAKSFKDDTFHVYLIVPRGDYDGTRAAASEIGAINGVVSVDSLVSSEAMNYSLAEELSVWQFADITGLELPIVQNIYEAYSQNMDKGAADGAVNYTVPFADIFMYTYGRATNGELALGDSEIERLETIYSELQVAKRQLMGKTCDRIIVTMRSDDSAKTMDAVKAIKKAGEKNCSGPVYVTGDNGGAVDFKNTFDRDCIILTVIISVLTLIGFMIILRSIGLPIVLTLIANGGVWISLAIPHLFPGKLMFAGWMLAAAIQLYAAANYSAVLAASYKRHKQSKPLKQAITSALKENYTLIVITLGMLILTGGILSMLSFNADVMSFGIALAISGVIDALLVTCVIPQTLLLWDIVTDKTAKSELALTSEAPKAPEAQEEERMDIVDAIERLKLEELAEQEGISLKQKEPDMDFLFTLPDIPSEATVPIPEPLEMTESGKEEQSDETQK